MFERIWSNEVVVASTIGGGCLRPSEMIGRIVYNGYDTSGTGGLYVIDFKLRAQR